MAGGFRPRRVRAGIRGVFHPDGVQQGEVAVGGGSAGASGNKQIRRPMLAPAFQEWLNMANWQVCSAEVRRHNLVLDRRLTSHRVHSVGPIHGSASNMSIESENTNMSTSEAAEVMAGARPRNRALARS